FRWGGEEFVLLCKADRAAHGLIGEKLLRCINALSIAADGKVLKVSLSIGSSYFATDDNGYLQAIKRADVALYHSKHNGKNRYTNWEDTFDTNAEKAEPSQDKRPLKS
ncbi:MAG: diguanylate cyclase, partial [Desulfovibrionaceae bacterium]|nr:diguanylate cyclase [Desulfovibrionaceae bacterium]